MKLKRNWRGTILNVLNLVTPLIIFIVLMYVFVASLCSISCHITISSEPSQEEINISLPDDNIIEQEISKEALDN